MLQVIHEICTSNAMDIASCVADLDYMQVRPMLANMAHPL